MAELMEDHLWYKDAIFYEVHVRAFSDSGEQDGIGDFRGLAGKLDYLQKLGVTVLWILPFYPSPLKDDGYDISDYLNVHPDYGTLADFNLFLKKAHQHGLKVITELVLNHTSDAHQWFQRARRSPPGSVWRDFYVWSDSPEKYRDARIIFKDFETSNWTWDPVAKAYYWHRFYYHQPELNYENPEVQKTMFGVVDFWLQAGVDGLRLDAVPYLYEREGTSCENLPETHEFLKKLRRHVDEKFKDRMLLAEANQWPEDAASYFGNGDECHMAFHFPIMPRLFMSIDMEDRFPIIDIMQQTPSIPDTAQWALFLRNHDELTLEMVTHEERDYMYRVYAADPKARINLGIRRRLAPLLYNHRRKIELMNGLLFSLPGTPIIYYGDEIGMGDNIYLGDRNGVRTPMQWSSDKNAGFSRANPQKLYLPIIIDPEYHYEAFNVEGQQNNLRSLFWWMKRLIALRKRYKAFGRGSIEFLQPINRKVLVFIRRYQNELILVIANLSRFVEYVELDLKAHKGMVPMELFSRSKFPTIGELPYFITLGPHEFYMFTLLEEKPATLQSMSTAAEAQKPVTVIQEHDRWEWTYQIRVREALEATLPDYFLTCRWFGGKNKKISVTKIIDAVPVPYDGYSAYMAIIRFEYTDAPVEQYLLPIAYANGERAQELIRNARQAVITAVAITADGKQEQGVYYDALLDVPFARTLLSHISRDRKIKGIRGEIVFSRTKFLSKYYNNSEKMSYVPALMKVDQSNTSIRYNDNLVLKIFRRLDVGISPDLEVGNFLTQKASFPYVAPVAGYLEYNHGQTMTLGILQGYVVNQGDALQYALDEIGRFFELTLVEKKRIKDVTIPENYLHSSIESPPAFVTEALGAYLESIRLLGCRTGELHIALASSDQDQEFAPVPFTPQEQRYLYQSLYSAVGQFFRMFAKNLKNIPEASQAKAQKVIELEGAIREFIKIILEEKLSSARIRCHGDFHLGQVLYTGKDYVFIDFEGEPTRSLSSRRLKQSPLKDVAGMVRSFHYASRMGLQKFLSRELFSHEIQIAPAANQWADLWYHWVSAAFLKSYLEKTKDVPQFAKEGREFETLLNIFTLEKSIYELSYELNNRPEWIGIPLDGILEVMERKNEPKPEGDHH
jgi:maltose alpha-D-glucosyltransferase/alpha-amylase